MSPNTELKECKPVSRPYLCVRYLGDTHTHTHTLIVPGENGKVSQMSEKAISKYFLYSGLLHVLFHEVSALVLCLYNHFLRVLNSLSSESIYRLILGANIFLDYSFYTN